MKSRGIANESIKRRYECRLFCSQRSNFLLVTTCTTFHPQQSAPLQPLKFVASHRESPHVGHISCPVYPACQRASTMSKSPWLLSRVPKALYLLLLHLLNRHLQT